MSFDAFLIRRWLIVEWRSHPGAETGQMRVMVDQPVIKFLRLNLGFKIIESDEGMVPAGWVVMAIDRP